MINLVEQLTKKLMNEEIRLNASLDLEYLFKNYIKARECSNSKTIHRAYMLLHTALAADIVYLDTKKIVEEKKENHEK